MNVYGIIYKATNLMNDKIYIGQTTIHLILIVVVQKPLMAMEVLLQDVAMVNQKVIKDLNGYSKKTII